MQLSLKNHYSTNIVPALITELKLPNLMTVPKITKVVISMGVGENVKNKKAMGICYQVLESISGQKPLITKARKSIAGFKIRTGFELGLKTTLRNQRMYDFLERLIYIALPRIRDFKGLKIKFDGNGNYNIGIRDYSCFTEVSYEQSEITRGLQITIVTSTNNDKMALSLLDKIGLPFIS